MNKRLVVKFLLSFSVLCALVFFALAALFAFRDFFPEALTGGLSRFDEGAATVLASFIVVAAGGLTAYSEYRRVVEQSSSSAALILLNEMVGIADEANDILRLLYRRLGEKGPAYSWLGVTINPGVAETMRDILSEYTAEYSRQAPDRRAGMLRQARTMISVAGGKSLSQRLADIGSAEPARTLSDEARDQSEARARFVALVRHMMKFNRLDGEFAYSPIGFYSNRSAYEMALPTLRILSEKDTWTESLYAVGLLYERCDYAETVHKRLITLLKTEDDDELLHYEITTVCLHYYRLVLAINLYFAPLAIARLLVAYRDAVSSFGNRNDVEAKLKNYFDKHAGLMRSLEEDIDRAHWTRPQEPEPEDAATA